MTAIALDTKSAFLEALAKTGKVKQACAEADCSRQSAYRWRDSDIEFATAWDRALESAEAVVEDEADDESGTPEPRQVTPSFPGAKYRLTELAFIDDRLCEPDTIIEFTGVPGHHMVAVNESARMAKATVLGSAVDVAQSDVTDFINDAAVRSATMRGEIESLSSKLLIARGNAIAFMSGTGEQKVAAQAELTSLQQQLVQKNAELASIEPMLEQAQEMAERAAREGLRLVNERARSEVDPALTRRVELATQIGVYAMLIGGLIREVLASGEQVWCRVRLSCNENVAWNCDPDPNAVSFALLGQLLRSGGIGLGVLEQLSPIGASALPSFEGVREIVERQNDRLLARL